VRIAIWASLVLRFFRETVAFSLNRKTTVLAFHMEILPFFPGLSKGLGFKLVTFVGFSAFRA
jgi:hypothetical protein